MWMKIDLTGGGQEDRKDDEYMMRMMTMQKCRSLLCYPCRREIRQASLVGGDANDEMLAYGMHGVTFLSANLLKKGNPAFTLQQGV